MLTTKNTGAIQAVDYFYQSHYELNQIRWYGQGAEILGLRGEVRDKQVFANICLGLTPDGNSRLAREHKRAAIDCTISAPKSVSLSALVGGDETLIAAHRKSVENTLKLLERNYTKTRIRSGGDRYIINTANIVAAHFEHIESRELDPHLHTHALVMNLTQTPNGSWYSLSNEQIYQNKKTLGMTYQKFLAGEVEKLGYEIEKREHGQFEIRGYERADLIAFSKRNQQIKPKMAANPSWKEREDAWSMTRKPKRIVEPEELKQSWRQQAKSLGIKVVEARKVVEINISQDHQLIQDLEAEWEL